MMIKEPLVQRRWRRWQNNVKVIREVPADRLLVWQVKEGWGPLCQVIFKDEIIAFRYILLWTNDLWQHIIMFFDNTLWKVESKDIWCCQQFLGVPIPDEPFPNVNDTPTMLDIIRWIIKSFNWQRIKNRKMKKNLSRKFKRIVAGTWAITVGLAGIIAYQLIWTLNTMLFYERVK